MASSDLTGLLGIVVIAGLAYVLLTSGALSNIGGADADVTGDPSVDADVTGETESDGTGTGCDDGHSCKKRCSEGWCNSYRKCCDAGCGKCGKGGGDGSNAKTTFDCGAACRTGNCTDYRANCKSGCDACSGTKGNKCPKACPRNYTRVKNTCDCKVKSGKTPSGFDYKQCSGKSGNCTWDCSGHFCWTGKACGQTYKTCTSGGGNCSGVRSQFMKKHGNCASGGGGGCTCKQGGKCASYPANSANCCSWRGRNGGCGSGTIGKPHKGGGCDCVRGSSYARALYTGAVPRVLRANSRLAWRLSTG